MNNLIKGERGQALPIVLILLLLGSLIVPSLMSHMGTGLIAGQVYEEKMDRFYAADSGVEDALWKIKNDELPEWMKGTWDDAVYNHVPASDNYTLSPVNDKDVAVSIQPIWVLEDLEPEPVGGITSADELIISGAVTDEANGIYQIKITYDGTLGDLQIAKIGFWLPPGFEFVTMVADDSDLDTNPSESDFRGGIEMRWDTASNPDFSFPAGTNTSKVVVFQFTPSGNPEAAFSWVKTTSATNLLSWDCDLKIFKITSIATDPTTSKQTTVEAYTAKSELRKLGSAMAGDYCAVGHTLMTSNDNSGSHYKYRETLFKESSATIQTITLAELEAAGGVVPPGHIPENATVGAAWLYWSGWIEGGEETTRFADDCSNFSNWNNPGSDWSISRGRFRGHHLGSEAHRDLTMQSSLNLIEYQGQTVILSWEQSEGGRLEGDDCLKFAFSADGSTWPNLEDYETAFCNDNPPSNFSFTIPDEYLTENFKMRFYLDGFNEWREYAYIDDITITVPSGLEYPDYPTTENLTAMLEDAAKVNRVMFGTSSNMTEVSANNTSPPTSSKWQVEENDDRSATLSTWSYSCFYNATDLVKQLIAAGDIGSNGSGTYMVGHVLEDGTQSYMLHDADGAPTGDTTGYPLGIPAIPQSGTRHEYAYAGWSLIIIYSTPDIKGHRLYLYDDFTFIGLDYELEIPGVSGFLAPDDTSGSHLTCFVGEGDAHYGDHQHGSSIDYIKINGTKLWDGSPDHTEDNVWNSYSNALDDPSINGIDIDTFDMSDYIEPGATSAEVIVGSGYEIYNVVYIILSFRSSVTTGGTISYLVRG